MRILIALVVLFLSGCATVAGIGGKNLQVITTKDVDAAIALAQQSGDADGLACWQAIKAAMPADGTTAQVQIDGVLSAWQEARNIRRGIQGGIDPTVHRTCAVLVVEAEQTLAKLGVRAGFLAKPVPVP